ncbi:2-phosphosulfolactate phosphatase [Oceanobacillus halophilus]|uniref:Probable 2-phosphosulfolactate phosphatase n=1 Tax=Oceanobacillus halophilus TaxID=930130 RepID=A0A495A7T7_9BACI|nr:2-phosphosulfolactate phosphatase [Oceanobacillus halophilus]RKQ35733.1 2-phosphosulfolactate phosphatase [Oceanobacillus halophilus]
MKRCRLWLSKEEIKPELLHSNTVVVIDVLLATTTLLTIMERGAKRVIPVENKEDAERLLDKLGETAITGGEQRGRKIDGFTLGHLPKEFPSEVVANKDVIFLSTNGTRAICRAANAKRVLLANLRNAPTVAKYLNTLQDEEVYIVCSGAGGHFSLEDFLCASIILSQLNLDNVKYNDAVQLALEQDFNCKNKVRNILEKSRVGRSSIKKGMQDLIDFTGDIGASELLVHVKDGELKELNNNLLNSLTK